MRVRELLPISAWRHPLPKHVAAPRLISTSLMANRVPRAAALKAECCEIIKEVDGVCSADPRIVANAKPLRQLDFTSLSKMCFWGAKVLHFRSAELAQSQNVPLVSITNWAALNTARK
jgi:uridylate kinase